MERKPLRIAMISLHSSPLGAVGTRDTGGMSIYIRELAKGLAGLGHSVDIFTRRQHKGQDPFLVLTEGVRVVYLDAGGWEPMPPAALSRHVQEFTRGVECLRAREGLAYDLLHSHYWLSGLVGRRLALSWRIPHVVLFHTLALLKNRALGAAIEPQSRILAERELCRDSDGIIATTNAERAALADWYDAPRNRVTVIPCGVDLNRFRPLNRYEARRSLGVAANDPVLLYVGRFDPVKGLSDLLGAMSLIQNGRPVNLMLVGGDEDSASESRPVSALVDELDLGGRVTLAGRVAHERLPLYYSAADALVVPSHYESFGLVGLEALACGTPVVATSVGAMRGLLADGRGGVLVRGGDPGALADGLRRMLSEREAGRYAVDRVRAVVRTFDWSQIAAQMEANYWKMLSRADRGAPCVPEGWPVLMSRTSDGAFERVARGVSDRDSRGDERSSWSNSGNDRQKDFHGSRAEGRCYGGGGSSR